MKREDVRAVVVEEVFMHTDPNVGYEQVAGSGRTLAEMGLQSADLYELCAEIEDEFEDGRGIRIVLQATMVQLGMTIDQIVDAIMPLIPAA